MTSTPTKPTVAFSHLGCEKNRVDTEHMVGLLAEAGYGVSTDERDAAVVVVNTCSFIQDAPRGNRCAPWWGLRRTGQGTDHRGMPGPAFPGGAAGVDP